MYELRNRPVMSNKEYHLFESYRKRKERNIKLVITGLSLIIGLHIGIYNHHQIGKQRINDQEIIIREQQRIIDSLNYYVGETK